MILNWSDIDIYIKPGATDMRKQINGLSLLVEEEFGEDLFNGNLFLFCSRNRRRLKIIYWDRNGFCLWLKRLEKDKFPWPKDGDEAVKITRDQLVMLLDGVNFFNAHKKINFSRVS